MHVTARAALRAGQLLLGILVVGLAVRAVLRQWDAAAAQPIEWTLRPGWIVLSVALVWLCYAVLIEAWRRAVVGMGDRLEYLPAARIWTVASLGKYLPGKIWATVGAATMARAAGVSGAVAVSAALLLQGLAVASGLVVVALAAPDALVGRAGGAGYGAVLALTAVTLAGVALLAWPRGLAMLTRLSGGRIPRIPPVPLGTMWLGLGANLLAWAGYGVAFVCLSRGLFGEAGLPVGLAIGSFTASYLAGLLALFAAGGLGVRESMLVLLLSGPLGVKLAVALAAASRLLLTLTELGAAVPFLFGRRRRAASSSFSE